MLYYKIWLESRARFFAGILAISLITFVFIWLHHVLMPEWVMALKQPNTIKPQWLHLGVTDFRFYTWHFLYDYQMQEIWVLFAILLGFGGLTREYIQGSVFFSLSLPVSRKRWYWSKMAVSLAEILLIGCVPAILIPVAGAYFNLHYPVGQGISHSLLMVVAGGIFTVGSNFLSVILRRSYYVAVSLSLFILGLPYIVLQEFAREIKTDSIAYRFDISHVMAGPWLLTWQNVPWLAAALWLAVAAIIAGLTMLFVRRVDY